MKNPLASIGLRGTRAEKHDDEEEEAKAKAAEEDEEEEAKAKAAEEDEEEEAKAKAAEEDEEEEAKATAKAASKLGLYARQVADLCTLASKPELAAAFIVKSVSTTEVRKALLAQRASASSAAEIAGHRGPDTSHARIDTKAIYAKFNHRDERRVS